MSKYYEKYCNGCGLCVSDQKCIIHEDENGYYRIQLEKNASAFLNQYCPFSRNVLKQYMTSKIWGDYVGFYTGYSNNEMVRHIASSGGIITSLCIYLLEKELVNGIIQIKENTEDPLRTVVTTSKSREEVLNCMGSRYTQVSPLKEIDKIIEQNKTYAFVGRPCDIIALKEYSKTHEIIRNITYFLSFFCAGTPSINANKRLIKSVGLDPSSISSITYRGNGWPGMITITDEHGRTREMEYEKAWMNILGRDINSCCKFCISGIGACSDISAGDFWKLDETLKPSFSEANGVNCIFSWSNKGDEILHNAYVDGYICLQEGDVEKLRYVQPNHFTKRSLIFYKMLGMYLTLKRPPQYPIKQAVLLAKSASIRKGIKCTMGTIKRSIKRRI